jgi:translation initiation factor 1 (eIF-1/SUI1)
MSLLTRLSATERNGRKTLTTVQGLPKKFDQKKILKVIKKKFGEHLEITRKP